MPKKRPKYCESCGHVLSISEAHKKAISEGQKRRWSGFKEYMAKVKAEEERTKSPAFGGLEQKNLTLKTQAETTSKSSHLIL